jgi:hypothetical protein
MASGDVTGDDDSHDDAPGARPGRPASALLAGMATACGSLPHADSAEAIELVLEVLPSCPSAPTLPNLDPHEGILGQAAAGIAHVSVAPDGTLVADDPDLVTPASADAAHDLPAAAFATTLAFLDAVAAAPRRPAVVKLQLTGPVTFGMGLVAAGVAPRTAFPLAAAASRHRARALIDAARARLGPATALVVVVDEPSMGAASLDQLPVSTEDAVDHLSGTLGAIEADAVAGVHCCAPADWGAVLRAGPALLSFPVGIAGSVRAADLGPFLEGGGWVAWGAVPTDGPLGPLDGSGALRLWRYLTQRWHSLADGGVDPVLLRQRALITPGCGLARHDLAQATVALQLTAALGERIRQGTFDLGRVSG